MEAIARKWSPEGDADTPYMRARQEWDNRMGSTVIQGRNWRLIAFISQGTALICIVGMIYLGAKPKSVPHIIEVDKLGNATYVGPIAQAPYTPSDATLKYHLRRFLEDTRSISSDTAIIKRNWIDAYNYVTPKGANMLTAYVQKPENEPFRRSLEERVTMEIVSTIRVSNDTWQIDWKETRWDKNANPMGQPLLWRGMFKLVLQPPKNEDQMARNPIGLYIDEFHWDKVGS